jgi:hypothetical protein
MEDENKQLDQNLKDQNGNQDHDDDQEENDENQNQNDDDQNDDNTDDSEETVDSLKEELAKAKKAYEDQKRRAEKAEGKSSENKDNKKVEFKKNTKADDLSPKDLYALMENKVPKEDVDDVVRYARFQKTSVDEALESDFVKRLLADKAEKRATARATNIGNSRRGSGKVSEQALLQKASQNGELPENDDDLDRLIEARLELKKQKSANKR